MWSTKGNPPPRISCRYWIFNAFSVRFNNSRHSIPVSTMRNVAA